MNALLILAKFLILLALVSVVPLWLAIYTGLGVLLSVALPIGAAILLCIVWMGRKA